eukprot:121939_1
MIDKNEKYIHSKTSFLHHGLKKLRTHRTIKNLPLWKMRNLSIPLIADKYFTPIKLNISSSISYTNYQYKTFNQLRSDNNHICDYLSVHGLEKSGTELLEYMLHIIGKKACMKQSDLSICNASHIGHWDKYQPLLPLNYNELDVQQLYEQNNDLRFCVFTIFRDLRDRVIAWRNKGNQLMERDLLRNIRIFGRKLKVWFNFYGNLEHKYPLQYYNLFYEDVILNDNDQIEKIINYIGLNDILDENDIEYIIKSIGLNALKENNINLFTNVNSDKIETICQMRNQLSDDVIEEMNMKIKSIHMQPELLKKFNETCAFSDSFFVIDYTQM